MKKKNIYYIVMGISILFIVLSMTALAKTKIIAPILIGVSLYLFVGAIIKLCKEDDRWKESIICALDLIFWLP